MAVKDQTVGWIVRRNTNRDAVADDDADIESTHLSAQASDDLDVVIKRDLVKATCACVYDLTFELCQIVFCHMGPRFNRGAARRPTKSTGALTNLSFVIRDENLNTVFEQHFEPIIHRRKNVAPAQHFVHQWRPRLKVL